MWLEYSELKKGQKILEKSKVRILAYNIGWKKIQLGTVCKNLIVFFFSYIYIYI